MTSQMLAPVTLAPPYNTWVNGNLYSGQIVTAGPSADYNALLALGYVSMSPLPATSYSILPTSGPSTQRPLGAPAGFQFYDTWQQRTIIYDGHQWRDFTTGAIAAA